MGNQLNDTNLSRICRNLDSIRERHPLVHSITNYVVMNFTANVLLALGASPIMAHAGEEMEEIVGLSNALVINIGTLSAPWVDSMLQAATAARQRNLPMVLDPVGAGATAFRTNTARKLAADAGPTVIRGNASEILALGGNMVRAKGVDSAHATSEARSAASNLAAEYGTVVAVTGPEDFITDGARSVTIRNGHSLMAKVTGTGCAASAIVGAFCAVESDPFLAAVSALLTFSIAGELAARSRPGPGTFQVLLLDALDTVSANDITERARIEWRGCANA